tara:strand:- start:885 stop:2507 length:1623 start_codon:yes stop_codon:yes gene_type:complete
MTATLEIQRRFLPIDETKVDKDTLTFSFSSEKPVTRYFGEEVLDHDERSVDLTRLNGNAAPLLFNHDPSIVLGKVERAWIEGKRGMASIKWATNARAKEVKKDVEEGILESISVGYVVNEMKEDGDLMRATSWSPHELSIVSIPADQSVGINRSLPVQHPSPKKEMSNSLNLPEPEAISTDWQSAEYQEQSRQFSVVEAMKGMVSGRGLSGRELEINQELEHQSGKRTQGFYLPTQGQWSKRAYVTSSATAGGKLIATDVLADNFIEALRARTVVGELGATMLPGLTGNVSIPKRTGDNTAYWIGADNADSITESTGTIGEVTMSPKTVGAWTKFSHLMSLQSTPEIEQLIRSGFVSILANAIDTAALAGSGSSNQPTGILNTSSIGSVAGGTNGAAADLDDFVDLKKEVSVDNADLPNCAFVTNAKVEGAISKLKDSNGDYILSPYGSELGAQQILSRRFEVTNNIPSNLSKGSGSNLSAILYGNFNDLLIGMWGGLEILVDPYTDFAKGTTGVRALQSIDIAVRHPESFAAMQDAIAA